ncbi:DUF427 domain-containing protein [Gordonia sp. ABSL11-1]|uniref:DUF427 domain-containing protein n=1 Tax=Gordonia sp. ABSL11-1 TaxID=3053924 RepID=UPI002572D529|nr:DUF427 domain-containing protein [Gordonia sp. ABSL11-1]MDL9944812.1 DUF427 domain-containing protein [Gordonia sp. ABSL11-1]
MAISMDEATMSDLGSLRWVDMRRRVRASVAGRTVVDSAEAIQVWEPDRVVGSYAVPRAAIGLALSAPSPVSAAVRRPPILTPDDEFSIHTCAGTVWDITTPDRVLPGAGFTPDDPDLADHVVLEWDAFDEWREEEQMVVAHPRDPFKRIDCLRSSRHVVVRAGDQVIADSRRPTVLLETYLPVRHYLPREDVRMDLLIPSETVTACAYKGRATYWSVSVDDAVVPDIAWTYTDPLTDGGPVRDLICFYDERVDVTVDASTG